MHFANMSALYANISMSQHSALYKQVRIKFGKQLNINITEH
jgi:hypothetical protein